jgi:hypothetical protein
MREELDRERDSTLKLMDQVRIDLTDNLQAQITEQQAKERDHFESEKAEFLQAIQENMQILDAMLKQYAVKSSQPVNGFNSNTSNSTIGLQ